jgi:hypothetical protein
MAKRKNTKRIDPRYFLSETTTRDLEEEYKMGDREMALTTAQVMAAQEAGIDPRSDLYMILLSATQGNSSKHLKVLQHPAFQEDPRVKKMGY